jgi:ATP-binding cassette subfamily C protein CydC
MKDLWWIFAMIWRDQRHAMWRGAALGVAVLLAGTGLLGLSGWFITASAAAGIAGAGAVFDVFRPSALVRFLALGRTVARYGERVLTHDATLRALAGVRVRLLRAYAAGPYDGLVRLRGPLVLNRLTGDVDALDGVPLRLILPIVSGLAAQGISFLAVWALAGLAAALWLAIGFVAGAAATLILAGRQALAPSRRAETAGQAFRSRLVDLVQTRGDLAVYGQLVAQRQRVLAADTQRQAFRVTLHRIERRAALALSILGTVVASGALALGMALAERHSISPALAATVFFVALALGETLSPLRRTVAELGRMGLAARRVRPVLERAPQPSQGDSSAAPGLTLDGVGFCRTGARQPVVTGVSLSVAPGQTLALVGPSGSGKSTVLLMAARLLTPSTGGLRLGALDLQAWDEAALRRHLVLVPQRSTLMAGSLRQALTLTAPHPDGALWAVLAAVALDEVAQARGGLDFTLGPQGAGLSGGEARRLVLARALLIKPAILLLDEPTEGLDDATALRVLTGIRTYLPQAAILTASHRGVERDWADRVLHLT